MGWPHECTLVSVKVDERPGGDGNRDAIDARLVEADLAGVFPEAFYATTNFPTEVRVGGAWLPVERIEMDVGIRVGARAGGALFAEGVSMHAVRLGDRIVVGEDGVRVVVPPAEGAAAEAFRFMSSGVSTERPKARLVAAVAQAMREARASGGKILFVGGPAIVHSGSAPVLERLVRDGWIDVLFAGNALAAHDVEAAMFGTSLGIDLARGANVPHGHQHHLRAINRVRRAGSLAAAVAQGLVTRGVMHACVTRPIPFVLAGSIRDDGPLPDVISDAVAAADAMREHVQGVTVAVIVATTLHGIATGNMLPASVATFCVDSGADTVIKLVDRGTHQAVGIVTDCEYFLGELSRGL
jgi:lysine-ketoglutarate reductase/saccharopine dehydrogenase-like protein (TIGR00300 family)